MAKTITFGLPCSPAVILSDRITENVERVILSYGGGIGGTTETMYIRNREKSVTGEPFMDVVKINGCDDKINKNFIVKITPVKLLTIVTDVTKHRNYNSIVCKSAIQTEVFVLQMDEVASMDLLTFNGDNTGRRIVNETEIK